MGRCERVNECHAIRTTVGVEGMLTMISRRHVKSRDDGWRLLPLRLVVIWMLASIDEYFDARDNGRDSLTRDVRLRVTTTMGTASSSHLKNLKISDEPVYQTLEYDLYDADDGYRKLSLFHFKINSDPDLIDFAVCETDVCLMPFNECRTFY